MAKAKFDLKGFLLKRGEHLAMGFAGFLLVVFLIYGASKWTSAQPPADTVNKFKSGAQRVHSQIDGGTADPNDKASVALADWLTVKPSFERVGNSEFSLSGPLFDPVGAPNIKRENPTVLPIRDHQVDLTRSAMLGYDITYDNNGDPQIAVIVKKTEGALDAKKIKDTGEALKQRAGAPPKKGAQPPQPKGNQPGPMPPGAGPMPPGVGPMTPASGAGRGESSAPYGSAGGEYSQNGQRDAIEYVKLKEIDKALKDGKVPALTVIPLRLVTVHAVVPYKAQLAELKRALRLNTDAEARVWGPWYSGFEVQRRVSRFVAGEWKVLEEWPEKPNDPSGNYKFEERYIERIDTRKVADHFEDGYIPYFLKPEYMLAMPLPALAKDLKEEYPKIRLKDITDNIARLEKANLKEVPPSEFAKRVSGSQSTNSLYKNRTSPLETFGYDNEKFGTLPGVTGPVSGPGPMGPMPPIGPPGVIGAPGTPGPGGRPPEGVGIVNTTETEIDNFLLRFVDCDVQPGFRYEYRIRLRMINPNYKQDNQVAVPEYAKESYKVLYSKWSELKTSIEVPAESFLYAHDVKTYREQSEAAFAGQKEMLTKMRAKEAQLEGQAVLQTMTWMQQVRLDNSSKREPVGTWVLAETPVGRGEYIGRKQFVKLPLWSSEAAQYQLREVAEKVFPKAKEQPKGWLVDFTANKSILVDFEGGLVKGRSAYRFDPTGQFVAQSRDNIKDEAATEVLILRSDGKLVVRNSAVDEVDPIRVPIAKRWNEWVQEIESRKPVGGGMGQPPGEFGRKD